MKNKQKISLVILLVILAVLVTGYLFVSQKNKSNTITTTVSTSATPIIQNQTTSTTSEISIQTWVRGDFSTDGIWRTTDSNGKAWVIDYKNAQYSESYIDASGRVQSGSSLSRNQDLISWLKNAKKTTATNYDGPGIVGSVRVIGTVRADGVLQASQIDQHVQ